MDCLISPGLLSKISILGKGFASNVSEERFLAVVVIVVILNLQLIFILTIFHASFALRSLEFRPEGLSINVWEMLCFPKIT